MELSSGIASQRKGRSVGVRAFRGWFDSRRGEAIESRDDVMFVHFVKYDKEENNRGQ
jgi:hypothetical protein